VSVLFGTGGGSLSAPASFASGEGVELNPAWLAAGDFDGDGAADLAVANSTSGPGGGAAVLLNDGGGTFSRRLGVASGTAPSPAAAVAAGDFNADGLADLAAAEPADQIVSVWASRPAGVDVTVTPDSPPVAAVVGRYVFYNNSAFDGNAAAANAADDAAVAPDKRALPVGQAASFANVTGYSKGINGVMVDISGLPAGGSLSPADFLLSAGGLAAAAIVPASVSVRRGAGAGGSDRVTLTFADNAVKNAWLRVTVLATAATGLAAPDVFSFGNLAGDATGDLRVNALDLAAVRRGLNTTVPPTSPLDFNRDGRVNALDLAAVKQNLNRTLAIASVAVDVAVPSATRRLWDEEDPTAS
jgi:hypothetical protein